MNTSNRFPKKFIILPVMLVAGIVVSSIFTTATSSVVESVKNNIARVKLDSEQLEEELQSKTSLTYLSDKINSSGFIKETSMYIKGAASPLASR